MTTDTTATTALEVLDHSTGEVLDIRTASDEQLARFCTNAQGVRDDLHDAEAAVHEELRARMDRNAKWTLRLGDPRGEVQWEVSVPSPTAGTSHYDPDALADQLAGLVDAGHITVDAAAKALERKVIVTFTLAPGDDMDALVAEAEQYDRKPKVETSRTSKAAGIKTLAKISPAVEAAMRRARRRGPAPARRVKVKMIGRES